MARSYARPDSRRQGRLILVLLLAAVVVGAAPAAAGADQASQPSSPAAGHIDIGQYHSCAVLGDANVRCWGYGVDGELGYGNTDNVGDDETPASVGSLDFGGHTVRTLSAGSYHTCAVLDDGTVRCWGYGGNGRLGYGNTKSIGAGEAAGSAGPVDLGPGRTAKAISAGGAHTCALLDDDTVRCWGFGFEGQLGYNANYSVGDGVGDGKTPGVGQTPGSVGPVDLGGHKVKAISAGGTHTCAILDDNTVRCWGFAANGQLGYANTTNVGDGVVPTPPAPPDPTPASVGPVDLGGSHTAVAISAGGSHTCAVLDDGSVRCWGSGGNGRLGYGNTDTVGAAQTPGSVAPMKLPAGRTAVAVAAGNAHTCVVLDDKSVRCWGYGAFGQLGYAGTTSLGGTPATTPDMLGPVDLGAGRGAAAISLGDLHTCALLDNGSVRCWGYGAYGRLGYCNESNVGDVQTPGSVGPVNLLPGDGGAACAIIPPPPPPPPAGGRPGVAPTTTAPGAAHPALPRRPGARRVDPYVSQALRAHALTRCLRKAARRARRHRARAQRACLKRYGRTPGRVTRVRVRAVSATSVVLSFTAPGSDGPSSPPARAYLIKQARRPIRGGRGFGRAQTLCKGSCRFKVAAVGTKVILTITHLRPHSTYYYAVAARDNVSGRLGPRSATTHTRTR